MWSSKIPWMKKVDKMMQNYSKSYLYFWKQKSKYKETGSTKKLSISTFWRVNIFHQKKSLTEKVSRMSNGEQSRGRTWLITWPLARTWSIRRKPLPKRKVFGKWLSAQSRGKKSKNGKSARFRGQNPVLDHSLYHRRFFHKIVLWHKNLTLSPVAR